MQLSVIIPTYNRADVLQRLLNLLATQTLDRRIFEVVIVDDGSTDDTPRVLAAFAEKQIFSLRFTSQENAGQGGARNRGIEMATGDILLFLGDDMLPCPSCLQDHLRFHILHAEQAAVALGRVRWHADALPTDFMRWLDRSGVQFKFHDLKKGEATDWRRFYTSNISIKKKFLGDERFDADFHGWGFEDTELGYRLAKKGMQLVYWPDALTEHLHHISAESLASRQFSAGQNAALFARKHPAAGIIPSPAKRCVQTALSRIFFWTYWAVAKRAFLAGLRAGPKNS